MIHHELHSNTFFFNYLKHVPIPVAMYRCEKRCCSRTYVPLEISYARTIHKFQGLTAGPVDPGKIPNMYQCILCDPDEKKFEGTSLGLFYTAVSRATTLGDTNGLNSAIYFTGNQFKEQRIRRLTKLKGSDIDFVVAQKRAHWVSFLKARERASRPLVQKIIRSKTDIEKALQTHVFTPDFLFHRKRTCANAVSSAT